MSLALAKLDVRPFSRLFKALGVLTRVRVVALLAHEEFCACHVEAALGLTQSRARDDIRTRLQLFMLANRIGGREGAFL